MSQFLIKSESVNKDKIVMTKDDQDFKHIFKVHRVKVGERINLLDEISTQYLAEISEINSDSAVFRIIEIKRFNRSEKEIFTLYQCLPKLNKMDEIIEKSIELGVDKIVPVISKNVVVELDEKSKRHKLNRWREIAVSAVKQSGNPVVPEICEPMFFCEVIKNTDKNALNLIGWEKGKKNLKEILKNVKPVKKINLLVGAEGGFDISEIENASKNVKNVWHDFRLKGNILRAETAPVVLISIIKYDLGLL